MGANSCSCSRVECAAVEALPVNSLSSIPRKGPEHFNTWSFNVFEFSDLQVQKGGAWMLNKHRGLDAGPEFEQMIAFADAVCGGYLALPYHNIKHGLDVLHTVWRLGSLMPWNPTFSDDEQFALLVAAFSHDLGHFGLTNVFLVDMRDELAIRYNDRSPLENMHCNKLFHILASTKTNVFSFLSKQDYEKTRKLVIGAILATDPAQHAAMLRDINAIYQTNSKQLSLADAGSRDAAITEVLTLPDNKALGARCLLYAADLSNPCRPWGITFVWAEAVLSEFFAQGDKEKELGVPVGMLNDRAKVNFPSSQLGFIQFMVAPFVSVYTRVFTNWHELSTILSTNVGEWARLVFEETEKDESGRVEAMRSVLAAGLLKIADKDTKAEPIEDSQTSFDIDAVVPRKARDSTREQDQVVAREVRRWRAQEEDIPSSPETRQYRELLLIYMISNGDMMASNPNVVMKFRKNLGHFNQRDQPEAAAENEFDRDSAANAPRVVSVASAVDNVHSQIPNEDFDKLLSSLLLQEDEKPEGRPRCVSD